MLVHQNVIKLADFGLAKRIEEASNSKSGLQGVLPYIDPKRFSTQWTNENKSMQSYKQSDVYSIGVLFWEISSGTRPFDKESNDIGLMNEISQGLRETPVSSTPNDYKILYTSMYNVRL